MAPSLLRENDSPNQLVLIVPDPDLAPLRRGLLANFSGHSLRMDALYDWLLLQPYLKKHLHKSLKELEGESIATFSEYEGEFAFKRNPLVTFVRVPGL